MNPTVSLDKLGIQTKADYEESQLVVDKGDDGLDRNAFLTLLTTQLQNQNPLDPMENEAFVAQLAQFSQLEATTQMSTSLESMAAQQRGDRILAGASLVGQQVLAETGLVKVNGESVHRWSLNYPQALIRWSLESTMLRPAKSSVISWSVRKQPAENFQLGRTACEW